MIFKINKNDKNHAQIWKYLSKFEVLVLSQIVQNLDF